jgi:hypothetical protein
MYYTRGRVSRKLKVRRNAVQIFLSCGRAFGWRVRDSRPNAGMCPVLIVMCRPFFENAAQFDRRLGDEKVEAFSAECAMGPYYHPDESGQVTKKLDYCSDTVHDSRYHATLRLMVRFHGSRSTSRPVRRAVAR